jgi:sterol desaturase/sphingolipid hydroxylase (fatty acid hydroxylase superfamily)
MLFTLFTLGVIFLSIAVSFSLILIHRRLSTNAKQPLRNYNNDQQLLLKRLPIICFNILALCIGMAWSFDFADSIFTIASLPISILVLQFFILLLLDDALYYFYHKLLHTNRFLFNAIHKIHHESVPPFTLSEFLYASPFEWIGGAFCSTLCIAILYFIFGKVDAYAFWLFIAFKTTHEVDIHSGIKSTVSRHIPFWGTAEYHEEHHRRFNSNYSSMFVIWDKIFKTTQTDAK